MFSGPRTICGHPQQEHPRAGIPSLSSHYHYLIPSEHLETQSTDGHSVSRRSAARNRTHRQIKPKIKIRLFFACKTCMRGRMLHDTFYIWPVLYWDCCKSLLQQRDWLPFEVAVSLEAGETLKLEKSATLLFAKLEEGNLLSKYMDAFCIWFG